MALPSLNTFFPRSSHWNYVGSRAFKDMVVLILVVSRALLSKLTREVMLLLCFTDSCAHLGAFFCKRG